MAIIIASHLVLNPSGVYHFRIVIPRPLRLIIGKTEVKKTLKTSNRRQAILLAQELSVKVEKAFQEVRLSMIGIKKPDVINLGTITMTGITSRGVSVQNVVIDRESPEEEYDIARALLDAIKDNPDAVREVVKAAEENLVYLTAMIEKYCAEKAREKAWVAETTEEFRGILNRLVEILGDIPVGTIGFDQARYYKETMMALPPNMNKRLPYRGKSIPEVISMRPEKTIGGPPYPYGSLPVSLFPVSRCDLEKSLLDADARTSIVAMLSVCDPAKEPCGLYGPCHDVYGQAFDLHRCHQHEETAFLPGEAPLNMWSVGKHDNTFFW